MAKRVALVHDYIKEYGGAERVLETLHEMYPNAPVFTLLYAPQFLGPHKERFKNWNIVPSFLQYIPFSYKFISIYRLLAPFVFKTFDFTGFDVIIVSATGAYSPNTINKKSAKQICYYHTPPRYLYGYGTAREQSKNPIMKVFVAVMVHVLRMIDYMSSKNVDICIANSENIKKRIQKFYRRDAVVVYPPVDIEVAKAATVSKGSKGEKTQKSFDSSDSFDSFDTSKNGYYLAGGRLARPKHIDLIVKACTQLDVPLKVFGKSFAGYGEELQKISGQKVEFLGEVNDQEKLELMSNAKAFIFAAEDEDFGIVPVEAMGQGVPVIAYKSGGVLETVVDGKTGVFFDELTVESLTQTIKKFEKTKINSEDCIKRAQKFSKENFVKNIKQIINS